MRRTVIVGWLLGLNALQVLHHVSDFAWAGGRLSTSLGGTLTGRGADFIIVDDPTKSKDAASQVVRESDKAWLLNTLICPAAVRVSSGSASRKP